MKIKAQVAMVMNLDKCIGCHTCSVTCKTTWTNREGAEYMWFNNVETKPGIGYPKRWEDQELYKGGWQVNKKGKLELKSGSKLSKIALGKIFYNPDMPEMKDYYEPWTYDYEKLTMAGDSEHTPVARAKSVSHGRIYGSWNGVRTGKTNWRVPILQVRKIRISKKSKKKSNSTLNKHL